MTLLPQVRSQLDNAAHQHSTHQPRVWSTRIRTANLPNLGLVTTALAVLVALAIAGGAIALLGHRHRPATAPVTRPATTTSTGPLTRPATTTMLHNIERFAASQFAVFARPQTAKDRSLPTVARRAIRLGGLGPGFKSRLNDVIPSLTRYTQTLPDGREVFLAVYNPADLLPPNALRHRPAKTILIIGPVIVQPDGKWTDGQPLSAPSGGETARDAYITARTGRQGCGLDTYSVIVPNQVARIRWQFGRQDPLGYVFKAPLTVNMAVHGNVAVATIPQRTSCDRPATVTLYGHNGQILSHTGNTSNLNRITRPINHGNPFSYKQLFHRPGSSTATH